MRPHSKPSSYYIKILWLLVCPAGLLLFWRIRESRRRLAIIQSRLWRDCGNGRIWISPSHQFLPKPLLGGKGWLYLSVLAPPSRARTNRPLRGRLPFEKLWCIRIRPKIFRDLFNSKINRHRKINTKKQGFALSQGW